MLTLLLHPDDHEETRRVWSTCRLGKDDLIADAGGDSRISMEDYAIAAVDELEKPQHRGERFTRTIHSWVLIQVQGPVWTTTLWLCGNRRRMSR